MAIIPCPNLLKTFPSVIAESPHLFAQIVTVRFVQQIITIAWMFRNIFRIIHGIIRFRNNARTVRPPEIRPDKKRLVLILCLINQTIRLMSHKVFNRTFYRPFMFTKHLLNLQSRIISQKAMRNINIFKPLLLKIFLIIIRFIIRRLIKNQAWENTASRKCVADKRFTIIEPALFRPSAWRYMPLARKSAIISCIMHTVSQ